VLKFGGYIPPAPLNQGRLKLGFPLDIDRPEQEQSVGKLIFNRRLGRLREERFLGVEHAIDFRSEVMDRVELVH